MIVLGMSISSIRALRSCHGRHPGTKVIGKSFHLIVWRISHFIYARADGLLRVRGQTNCLRVSLEIPPFRNPKARTTPSNENPMVERKKPLKKEEKSSDLAVVKIDSLAKCPWNGAVLFSGCPIIAAWPWMPRISKRVTTKNSSISTETIRPNVKR